MSDTAQALGLDALLAQVNALGSHASPRPDPVRLHYIQALARRLQAAPPAVQKVLRAKLEEALKAVGSNAEPAAPIVHTQPVQAPASIPALRKSKPKAQPEAAPQATPMSMLGQLNHHLHTASQSSDVGTTIGASATAPQDLKSAIRFRETWARISAETEVDKAAHRAPENAGPLNAHNLVLRTLGLMRELSPDYLRRFMSHTESLLWLDQAYGQLKQPAGKAKAAKSAKPKH